ncbi:MAG: PQQ-binding-like beta-propeller repeat protein [Phototrophicaceae bacterium]
MKKLNRTSFLLLLVVILAGCAAQVGTGWAGLTVLNDGRHVAWAYEDLITVVDITDGQASALLDEDGDELRNGDGEVIRWRVSGRELDGAKFFAAPLQLDDLTLVAPSLDRRLLRFDLSDASIANLESEPIIPAGSLVTTPALIEGHLLVGLPHGLAALDPETYETLWTVNTGHAVWSQPTVLNGVVYFVSLDHFMYAVNLEDGAEVWKLDIGGASTTQPLYGPNDSFYIGTFNSTILEVSAAGEILQTYNTNQWIWGNLVLAEDGLFASDLGGYVYKLDPATLTLDPDWSITRVATAGIRTAPLVFDDYVVVGSRDKSLYWINRETGSVIFSRPLDGEILADLHLFRADEVEGLDNDLIVVSTLSNREALVGFTTSGDRVWTFRSR